MLETKENANTGRQPGCLQNRAIIRAGLSRDIASLPAAQKKRAKANIKDKGSLYLALARNNPNPKAKRVLSIEEKIKQTHRTRLKRGCVCKRIG